MSDAEINANTELPPSRCGAAAPGSLKAARWATVGGALAALGLCAACCVLPAVLIALGIGGTWIGSLDSLVRYKWLLVAMSAALLAYAFYVVYMRPKPRCAAGPSCTSCAASTSMRWWLWGAVFLASASLFIESCFAGR